MAESRNGRRQTATATSEAKPATVEAPAPALVEAPAIVEAADVQPATSIEPATVEAPAAPAFTSAPAIAPANAPAKLSDQTISELKRMRQDAEKREAENKEIKRIASRLKSDVRTRQMTERDMSAHTVWFYRNPRTLKDTRFKRDLHSTDVGNGHKEFIARSANDIQIIRTSDDLTNWRVEIMQM